MTGNAVVKGAVVTHPAQVAKAIVYLLLTAAAIFLQAKGVLDIYVYLAMGVAVVGVVPVYFVIGTVGKTVVGFVLAGGQGALIVIGQSATLGSIEAIPPIVWVGLIVSAFAAIGIAVVPNAPLTLLGNAIAGPTQNFTTNNYPPARD